MILYFEREEMKKIKGVIFDVDGVIFDTERISSEFWTKTMKKHGYHMDNEIYSQVMGRNAEGVISGLEEIYKDPNIDFRAISKEKVADMVEYLDTGDIPVKTGVFEIIDYLEKNDYKRAVATSTRKERAKKRLEKEGIYKHMHAFMYGDEVTHSKPNPEIFLRAAEKINLKPEECLVIEDSPAGVEAASRGGFVCINVVDMKQPTEEMKRDTVAIYDDRFGVIDWLEENNK